MRIAVSGHMDILPSVTPLLRDAIQDALLPFLADGIVGVSCIAKGSDSLFAEVVLDLGGELEVVLPAEDYRRTKVKPEQEYQFDNLIQRATLIITLPNQVSNRHAYEAANNAVLDRSDMLIAIWDGKSPVDRGGTAAVVDEAHQRAMPVTIVWPPGAARVTKPAL